MSRECVVIGNCGGFWGDDPRAARQQLEGGPVDYLVADYLAEVTMAVLQKLRSRRPEAGFATDILDQLRPSLAECKSRGVRFVTNAGGVNPGACGAAVRALATELGLGDSVRVGVISGDDLTDEIQTLLAAGHTFTHLVSGEPVTALGDRILRAHAYLGAAAVVTALADGADVVVTGRVADASLTLGPLMHEFGWAPDDWDRLAAGIVAGHILECGAQACGGNFTDWRRVPGLGDIGYPIVEVEPDGGFVVTKHPGTGGCVTVETVTEQLLYEIAGPAYPSPDCVAHFDSIRLVQDGPDRVRVNGVRGGPAPEQLKVSVNFSAGYRIVGRMMVTGPDTLAKADAVTEIVWRAAGGRDTYEQTATNRIGWDACHPPLGTEEPGEVLVEFLAMDPDRQKLDRQFAPSIVARGLAMVPGICGPADQGRPRASEAIGFWPALIDRDAVTARVELDGETRACRPGGPPGIAPVDHPASAPTSPQATGEECDVVVVPLSRLCLARSGDKGDIANIGVIARSAAVYDWMVGHLTEVVVAERFAALRTGRIERHLFPNLRSMNFVLHGSLGGGGTISLRFDAQGKSYAQFLLALSVTVPAALLHHSTVFDTLIEVN